MNGKRFACLCLFICGTFPQAVERSPFLAPHEEAGFSEFSDQSLYLPMKDGARLAVEVILPKGIPAGTKIPALVRITRYGRVPMDGSISAFDKFWAGHGFARVLVDERGTGASFGTLKYGKASLGDMREIANWVTRQAWSNGRIGAVGPSYDGTMAELLAATGHPAVRAAAPFFSDFDYYRDLIRPGGVFNEWLMKNWQEATAAMDGGEAAKKVDTDIDGSLLKGAILDHAKNGNAFTSTQKAEFIDDDLPAFGGSLYDASNASLKDQLRAAHVPMLIFASWFDAATVQGTILRFKTLPNEQHIFIGPWNHGGRKDANPFSPLGTAVDPPREQQLFEALRFFDYYLKDAPENETTQRRLFYETIEENSWKSPATWPPSDIRVLSFHLLQGGELSATAGGVSEFSQKFNETNTGDLNRWHSQATGDDVSYREVLGPMQSLPSFTTAPLESDTEITGQPVLHLRLSCAETDPSVFAYLLAVDSKGTAYYLTEGQLRLINRKLSLDNPTLHSFKRADAEPIPANKEIEADITLLPFSAFLRKGFRLRLLLASGDTSTFRTAGEFQATLSVRSTLDLPVKNQHKVQKSNSTGEGI